ncbi:MAG: hypothetical protein U1F65_02890 [Verrucomicrobiota bacterium]
MADKYRIEPLCFKFDALQVSSAEKLIPIEQHPFNYGARFSHSKKEAYPRQVITFHLPFTGDQGLLNCQPSNYFTGGTAEVSVSNGEVRFDLINWRDDTEELKREQANIIERIRKLGANVEKDVKHFNEHIAEHARQAISARRALLLKQTSIVAALGVPLRKASGVPQTFAVPIAPKKLAVKPTSSDKTFAPQPTLNLTTYQDILSIIHDTGVAMERHPSTYAAKQEEDLRDFLLMTLCSHYPNTTGETFNKKGKTDILVRYEGANVFVGECKFWNGLKAFHETIDQILGYLTWRDSKAAIVCFVSNKELGPVLEQISSGAPEHPCFVRLESKRAEGWTQFEFRLKSDSTRSVHLAVLCFHFPPAKRSTT